MNLLRRGRHLPGNGHGLERDTRRVSSPGLCDVAGAALGSRKRRDGVRAGRALAHEHTRQALRAILGEAPAARLGIARPGPCALLRALIADALDLTFTLCAHRRAARPLRQPVAIPRRTTRRAHARHLAPGNSPPSLITLFLFFLICISCSTISSLLFTPLLTATTVLCVRHCIN